MGTRRALRTRFAVDFNFARRVLELGYEVDKSLCDEHSSKFGNEAKAVCIGVYTRLCKQYRGIHALCELGLTDDAEILVRSMFESSLVTLFLLRRRVVFRNGRRLPPTPPKGGLTVAFRVKLFVADQALKERKMVRAWLGTPGLRRKGKSLAHPVNDRVATEEKRLGSQWMCWLKDGILLGLSVETMARNLGMARWYAQIYRPQSSKVHGSDALDHLDLDDVRQLITPKLGPDVDSTTEPLCLANELFLTATDVINRRFRLRYDDKIRDLCTQHCQRGSGCEPPFS
jgi:hypothetical protein